MPSTPQQNVKVERKFATLFERMHVMSNVDKFWHHVLWPEVGNTTSLFDDNLVTTIWTVSPFGPFFGMVMKSIMSSPQKFGKSCLLSTPEKIKTKKKNQG